MSDTLHTHFIETASELSPALAEAIASVGAFSFVADQSMALSDRLARSVAGQQLSVTAASTIWGRVEAAARAQRAPLDQFLSEKNAELLRACGLSGAKVRTVLAIGAAARAGRLEAAALHDHSAAERAEYLTAIKGVGPWTADMINIFYFGESDIWPEGDVTARKTLERLTSKRRKTMRTAQRFAPNRSKLALYMWRVVDGVPG